MRHKGDTPQSAVPSPRLDGLHGDPSTPTAPAASPSPTPDSAAVPRHRVAVALITLGSCVMSLGGLIVRSMEGATSWQIVFYRGVALSVGMTIVLVVQNRGRIRAITTQFASAGRWAALAGLLQGFATTSFVISITHTTVANTLFILSAAPFVTALLGRWLLKEAVLRSTWITMAIALIGIVLMVGNGLVTGTLLGNVTALLATLGFSCFVVTLRRGRARNMLPAVVLGGALAALFGAAGAGFDVSVSVRDLALCILWGGVIQCTAHFLFVLGSRRVTGAEFMLLVLVEVVAGPIWVWFAFGEVPALLTLVGGSIVVSAVAGGALIRMSA